jgi:hypothetical protein
MRDWFDRAWPKLEVWGLKATGLWLALFAVVLIAVGMSESSMADGGIYRLPVAVVGAALLLAAVLIYDRSREDLAERTVQAATAIVLAYLLLSGNPEIEVQPVIYWLLWLGSVLFGLRAFRGGFRQQRRAAAQADS